MPAFDGRHNIIPIYVNEKRPYIKWMDYKTRTFSRHKLNQIKSQILHKYNADINYAVMCGKTSNNLCILDFDLSKELKGKISDEQQMDILKEILSKLPNDKRNTKIVSTHSGGLHLYYYIDGETASRETQKKCNIKNIAHFDILGNDGYAIIPPSKINGRSWKNLNGNGILTITSDKLQEIIINLTPKVAEKRKAIKKANKVILNGIDFSTCRLPFQQILSGELEINDLYEQTGEEKRFYWRYLFHEIYHECGLKKEYIIPILQKNSKSFNTIINKNQKIDYRTKKANASWMKRLFPDYKSLGGDSDYEYIAKKLMDKYKLIAMTDSHDLLIKKGNIYISANNSIDYNKDITDMVAETSKPNGLSIKRNIESYIVGKSLFDRKNFCYDDNIINFANGYYNLIEKKFYNKSDSEDKIFPYEIPHKITDIELEKDCPLFRQYLGEWLGENNTVKIDDIFEMMGYSMTMSTMFKTAFYIWGRTNSGKTTFQTILEGIIGHDNRKDISLQDISADRFATSDLQFATLNMCGESPIVSMNDVNEFKKFTGGDRFIGAVAKFGKRFEFRNMVKFWHNGNNIPQLTESAREDEAFFGRWILIHFPNMFSPTEASTNRNLAVEILNNTEEMEGIIVQCIKGAIRLYDRRYFEPYLKANTETTWKYESDDLFRFLKDQCEYGEGRGSIQSSEFRMEYIKWAHKNRKQKFSPQELKNMLEIYAIWKERPFDDRKDYYTNVKWKPEPTATQRIIG